MTETLSDRPPPPPHARRLVRSPDEQVVVGVCAAFARYTDTDPVLWRVTVAVLTLFGGAGLALYAAGWLLVPKAGEPQSVAERVLRRDDPGAGRIVLLVLGALVLMALLDNGPGLGTLLVVGGIAYLVQRERRDGSRSVSPWFTGAGGAPGGPAGESGDAGSAPAPPRSAFDAADSFKAVPDPASPDGTPTAPAWSSAVTTSTPVLGPVPWGEPPPPAYETTAWGAGWPDVAPPPEQRSRSPLGALTLSTAALAAGVLLAVGASGANGVTGDRVVATLLVVVGAGLLVGTWWGRARWLIAVGLVLTLALPATAFAARGSLPVSAGIGERTWTPAATATTDEYRLGMGEATLDLRGLAGAPARELEAQVGLGLLEVVVPEGLSVRFTTHVGAGDITFTGPAGAPDDQPRDGTLAEGTGLSEDFVVGTPGDVTVELDLRVGLGEVVVRRVAA